MKTVQISSATLLDLLINNTTQIYMWSLQHNTQHNMLMFKT